MYNGTIAAGQDFLILHGRPLCTSESQNNSERRFVHSVYTQASGRINFGDVNRTFKSTTKHATRTPTFTTYILYTVIHSRRNVPVRGYCVSHLPFWRMYFWPRLLDGTGREEQGRRIFGGPKVRRQLKLNVTLLIIKAKLYLQPLPLRLLTLHHSNYYTACNFNRVYPPPPTVYTPCSVYTYLLTYILTYLPTYSYGAVIVVAANKTSVHVSRINCRFPLKFPLDK